MAIAHELASFAVNASDTDLSSDAREQLRVHLLDGIGCALGALGAPPIQALRAYREDVGVHGSCALIGGGAAQPVYAALCNGALVRYLDFNDSYLAAGETCHPSDNIGAVLAAAEHANASGRDVLAALGVAYQVQCRLSDEAPVRAKGFDHTTQGSYAAAAGVARALGLDESRAAHAIAIAGTAFNALRVTRTGTLSHWKGMAYPNTGFCATHACFMAKHGITGPPEVFEGNKGFMDAIAGDFELDWQREDLERVKGTIIKQFNAEIHSQSSLEGVLELQREHRFEAGDVEAIELEIFDVAYHIIGGGEEGDKYEPQSKEQADHSLPYMVAAAVLDGEVTPAQYTPDRLAANDIRAFIRRVRVRPSESLSGRFPQEMPVRIRVRLRNGRTLERDKHDYEGFHTRPMSWDAAVAKLRRLCPERVSHEARERIVAAIADLERISARELSQSLSHLGG